MSDDSDSKKTSRSAEPRIWRPEGEPAASPAIATDRRSTDERPKEYGGRDGLDPTRYGDWEKNGRCIDF